MRKATVHIVYFIKIIRNCRRIAVFLGAQRDRSFWEENAETNLRFLLQQISPSLSMNAQ